jgi:L-rhamnose mutarotase
MIKRFGTKMKLYPGFKEEYRKRHDGIWPEMVSLMKKEGIRNYSIFIDEETDTLFSYFEISGSYSRADHSSNEIVKKWWKHMSDIMETHPDNSPVSVDLEQVFYLD